MPRGKRTVFAMFCPVDNSRNGTVRLHKQNVKGVSWKDFKPEKFCQDCRSKQVMKLKEEKHSS